MSRSPGPSIQMAKETNTFISDPWRGLYHADETVSDVAVSATIPGLSADLKALIAPVPGL